MSVPSIPTTYNHNLNVNPLDVDLDAEVEAKIESELSGELNTIHGGSIETILSGSLDLNTDNVLTLKGDSNQPVATDSKIEILNLPRFTLDDIKDMMKVRVRIPNYSNVCLKILGIELMSVSMGGESQVITEPYIPNTAEKCETDCCEPDTRPFPDKNIGKAKM